MSVVGECRWPQLQPINEASCTGGRGWDNKIKGKSGHKVFYLQGSVNRKQLQNNLEPSVCFISIGEKIAPLEVMIDQVG